jgi:hypothetical protein
MGTAVLGCNLVLCFNVGALLREVLDNSHVVLVRRDVQRSEPLSQAEVSVAYRQGLPAAKRVWAVARQPLRVRARGSMVVVGRCGGHESRAMGGSARAFGAATVGRGRSGTRLLLALVSAPMARSLPVGPGQPLLAAR